MTFSLGMANVSVLGNLNPYIVSPEWLISNEILETSEFHLAFGAVVDGVRFRSGKTEWQVDNKSLQIFSIDNCGGLAAKVLRKLPHTPVRAIGLNFDYSFDGVLAGIEPNLGDEFQDSGMEFEVRKWSGVLHNNDDGSRVEMTVVAGSQGVSVGFNHHMASVKVDELIKFAESFSEKEAYSKQLIKTILKEDVK